MSDIPSANQKIQIEPTQYRAPVSESLAQTMGGSINYALDQVSSIGSSLSSLTTQLNSSAEAMKQTATYNTTILQIGNNNPYSDGTLIDRDTLTIPAASGEWWSLYFACNRVDTTRSASFIKITLANEPDFASTILLDSAGLQGSASPLILPPGTGNYTVYVDLYAAATASPSPTTRNRWDYRIQGFRFDPTRFIIP